ncbi:MAG: hypothetical protein FWE09_00470 [Treponema sp.]|nr:hypothetical protein [Treponema sp.]
MKDKLLWLWQAPQHLLGLALIAITKAKPRALDGTVYWHFERKGWFTKFISGGSFGAYILMPQRSDLKTEVPHEGGHSRQSARWGPLYLPVIGVYSAVFCNLWDRWFHKSWETYDRIYWYYMTRWTERQADRLGGVDRAKALRRIPRTEKARFPAVA